VAAMSAKRLPEEINKHPNEWVALNKNKTKVLAHDPDLNKAVQKAEDNGEKEYIMYRTRPSSCDYMM